MSFRLSWMLQSSFKSMTDVTGAGMTVDDEDDAEVGGVLLQQLVGVLLVM